MVKIFPYCKHCWVDEIYVSYSNSNILSILWAVDFAQPCFSLWLPSSAGAKNILLSCVLILIWILTGTHGRRRRPRRLYPNMKACSSSTAAVQCSTQVAQNYLVTSGEVFLFSKVEESWDTQKYAIFKVEEVFPPPTKCALLYTQHATGSVWIWTSSDIGGK